MFSIPFFDWQNDALITRHFWLYWAITIPLTMFVLLVWTIWIRWSIYLHDKQDAAARKGGSINTKNLNGISMFAEFKRLSWLLPKGAVRSEDAEKMV